MNNLPSLFLSLHCYLLHVVWVAYSLPSSGPSSIVAHSRNGGGIAMHLRHHVHIHIHTRGEFIQNVILGRSCIHRGGLPWSLCHPHARLFVPSVSDLLWWRDPQRLLSRLRPRRCRVHVLLLYWIVLLLWLLRWSLLLFLLMGYERLGVCFP